MGYYFGNVSLVRNAALVYGIFIDESEPLAKRFKVGLKEIDLLKRIYLAKNPRKLSVIEAFNVVVKMLFVASRGLGLSQSRGVGKFVGLYSQEYKNGVKNLCKFEGKVGVCLVQHIRAHVLSMIMHEPI